ncbi:unnamed protein product [Effrenium voratum]|nr:unnamed protein product [Effrenium voratum]
MQGYQAYQTSGVTSPICRAHVDGRRNAEVTFRRRPLWRLAQLLGLQPLVKHLARQVRPWRRRTAPWRRTTRRKLRRAWQESGVLGGRRGGWRGRFCQRRPAPQTPP